ncbi:ssk1 response regulator receiver [Orbilia brochopaga]|uniref:Ssk1 response regulator receiver n=1 Tax=Orbilia brochopaga TaxID=3140254 RepID=A0AAV9VFT8_9PEZI
MLLWKAAATKIRAVRGMRGFRDKIKGTKTKLLRRDSKDSTEDVSAIRPLKAAKGSSNSTSNGGAGGGTGVNSAGGGGDAGGGGGDSLGRKSKRLSLMGRHPSRSDQSLATASVRTVDTTEPETPTFAAEPPSINGADTTVAVDDIVIEGGTAPVKRRSGDCPPPPVVQPQQQQPPFELNNHNLNLAAHSQLQSQSPPPIAPIASSDIVISTADASIDPLLRDIPVVLVQKDCLDPKSGLAAVPAQLPQKPLAENENLQHPHSNAAATTTSNHISISIPTAATVIATAAPESGPAEPSSPLTVSAPVDKPAGSDPIAAAPASPAAPAAAGLRHPPSKPKLADRPSADQLRVNTTNLPPPGRSYRLPQYSADSRTDAEAGHFSLLRRASSRTSLSTTNNEPGSQDPLEGPGPDSEKRESISLAAPHAQESLVYTSSPLAQPPETVPVPLTVENIQTLDTVSETQAGFQPELNRNESVKSNRPTLITSSGSRRKPISFSRRQSLIHSSETGLLRSLLDQETASPAGSTNIQLVAVPMPHNGNQASTRRVWVKRPGGSPTQVVIAEDDFVDTVRDLCLRKYSNALGRQYDSPDLMIRVIPPAKPHSARTRQMGTAPAHVDRVLLPDEILCQILDDYYPNGQTSEDALVIEVPQQQRSRTPRPSPGPHAMSYAYGQTMHDLALPGEDYFTPIGITPHSQPGTVRSAHTMPPNASSLSNYMANSPPPSSPGHRSLKRPGPVRMTTGSPVGSTTSSVQGSAGGVMLIPRAGAGGSERIRTNAEGPQSPTTVQPQMVALPQSPGVVKPTPQKPASPGALAPTTSPTRITKPPLKKETIASIGTLDGQVPSINVLIVEDNIINLRLLEAFMKRLKVRWATAMNGRDAVTKWRTGGFQLVLMDIQLPIMNGLDATKEIRRLERLNGIGSFPSHPASPEETLSGADKLDLSLVFKGSVIIVALTASSLQSDREEALAVGCNDFLTKPVNFTFLERKVMEWGCMQALIDFEGWRKWKDLASKSSTTGGKSSKGRGNKATSGSSAAKEKDAAKRDTPSPSSSPTPRAPGASEEHP